MNWCGLLTVWLVVCLVVEVRGGGIHIPGSDKPGMWYRFHGKRAGQSGNSRSFDNELPRRKRMPAGASLLEEETTWNEQNPHQRDLNRFWREERERAAQTYEHEHARDELNEERLLAQLLLNWIRDAQKKSYLP